ncbi:hypothetical protein M0R45_021939 [Rubus argutus]|uniref:Uncharacterized protein n=1 Tax=Rubus argutus TaxID=59490 RepID=A0AAW1XEI3_RUBAR
MQEQHRSSEVAAAQGLQDSADALQEEAWHAFRVPEMRQAVCGEGTGERTRRTAASSGSASAALISSTRDEEEDPEDDDDDNDERDVNNGGGQHHGVGSVLFNY